jgi:hypothetical protein
MHGGTESITWRGFGHCVSYSFTNGKSSWFTFLLGDTAHMLEISTKQADAALRAIAGKGWLYQIKPSEYGFTEEAKGWLEKNTAKLRELGLLKG